MKAQDVDRKWALNYTGGAWVKPVLTSNPSGLSLGNGSSALRLIGEYYLPEKWNIQAGYFRTDLSYGDAGRTMEGLQLGLKKYFVNPDIIVQPYLSGAGQVNWSRHIEYTNFEYMDYSRWQQTKNPRISFVPGIGFELFLFSSVAFVAEYNFNIALNSQTAIELKPEGGSPYTLKDKGMYHNLQLGVKFTFPFIFTRDDVLSVFTLIMDLFSDSLERRYEEKNHIYY
ncbi:MAG: hypothetical protein LBH58_00995 [Tannerellaceae bacterium]|jgi:hypothetical protein|nr:hypothetical protein [Tannerellaceae bacterium]